MLDYQMNQAIIYTKECFIPIFYQDLLEPNMQAEKKKRSLSAPMCFTTSILLCSGFYICFIDTIPSMLCTDRVPEPVLKQETTQQSYHQGALYNPGSVFLFGQGSCFI